MTFLSSTSLAGGWVAANRPKVLLLWHCTLDTAGA